MKAANVERDWKDKARDAELGELKEGLGELRMERNVGIDNRTGAGAAEDAGRDAKQHKRSRISDDAVNFGAILVGGGVGELAYHLKELSPETAGIATTVIAAGAAGYTWARKRWSGEAEKDADHRPKG